MLLSFFIEAYMPWPRNILYTFYLNLVTVSTMMFMIVFTGVYINDACYVRLIEKKLFTLAYLSIISIYLLIVCNLPYQSIGYTIASHGLLMIICVHNIIERVVITTLFAWFHGKMLVVFLSF